MRAFTSPVLAALVCLGLVFAGIAVGLPGGPATEAVTQPTDAALTDATEAESSEALTPEYDGYTTVSNEHLVLYAVPDGSRAGAFGLQTVVDGEYVDLLRFGGGLVVTVDGTTYRNAGGDSSLEAIGPYLSRAPTVLGESIVTEWTLPEDVVVTQTITLDGEVTDIDVAVDNTGTTDRDVTATVSFDQRRAIWLDGGPVRTTTTYADPAFDSWRAVGYRLLTPVVAEGRFVTQPDEVTFAQYATDDAATGARVRYVLGGVAAGEDRAVSLRYGIGEPVRPGDRATVSIADEQPNSEPNGRRFVLLDEVLLPDGGWFVLYGEDGERLPSTRPNIDYDGIIPPGPLVDLVLGSPLGGITGQSQEMTVVAFRDTDGDGLADVPSNTTDLFAGDDQPYLVDGEPVSDTEFVVVGTPPKIDAGDDLTVLEGETVELEANPILSGGGFIDSVSWTQVAGPAVETERLGTLFLFVAPPVDEPTTLTFEVLIVDNPGNTDTDRVNVTVEPRPSDAEATASVDLRFRTDGRSVEVRSVSLSNGGFVTIHDESLADGDAVGSVVGVSEYLPPGSYDDVEIFLFDVPGATYDQKFGRLTPGERTLTAMVHLDSDLDEQYDFVTSDGAVDGPYRVDGVPVTDTQVFDVELYYQVDLVAGEPYERLGPAADNGFYADRDEDRLFQWAQGIAAEGLVLRGSAWPSEDLRTCVESRSIGHDPATNTASVEVTVTEACPQTELTLTLAVYEKPNLPFSPSMNQTLVASTTVTVGPGTHVLEVELPEVESES
jgi:hypothetical protein